MSRNAVQVLREKLQNYLPRFVGAYEVRGEAFAVRHKSVRIFIQPREWIGERTLVQFVVPVLREVPDSDALYRKLSEMNSKWFFGRCYKEEDRVIVDYTLLGDFLDYEELESAVICLVEAASDALEELKGQFGGRGFLE